MPAPPATSRHRAVSSARSEAKASGGMPPADFTRLLTEEAERWRKVAAEGQIEKQ